MSAITWAGITLAVLIVALEAGRRYSARAAGARDSVKQATGVVGTLTALVLGLLIGGGQQSFGAINASIAGLAVGVATLDETLGRYGAGADAARVDLRAAVPPIMGLWDKASEAGFGVADRQRNERFLDEIASLPATTPREALLRDEAQRIAGGLVETRLRLGLLEGAGVPVILLGALVGWLCVVFAGLGLCLDGSAIGRISACFGAAAMAMAVFLVVEFDSPFDGLLQVSRQPLALMSAMLGGQS